MNLDLENRLTPEEINELRKRAFSYAEQMFFEGISVGRELNREPLQEKTEKFIKDKLSAMSKFIINDDVWKIMPAQGYNPNPNVTIPDVSDMMNENMNQEIDNVQNMYQNVNNAAHEEAPEWAKETKPFK